MLYKNHVTNNEEAFTYEERHSFDKSLLSELSSFNFIRSPVGRCFRLF